MNSAFASTDPIGPDTSPSIVELVLDAAPEAMLLVDASGRIMLVNRRADELFGAERASGETLAGSSVDDLLPETLRAAHARQRDHYARRPRTREMGSGLELLGRRIDGSEVPVEVSLAPVRYGDEPFVLATVRSIAAHTDGLAHGPGDGRVALLAERERIGRDLHDSVIQRLYGVGLSMQASLEGSDARRRDVIEDAIAEIDDTIAEIRTVIHGLRRDADRADRLDDRLRGVITSQAAALGIPIRLHVVGRWDTEPPPEIADAILAVVRECIANAHRHGRAGHIDVDLENAVDDRLRVTVHDDGRGFDPDLARTGYGLENLRVRAADFGGAFTIASGDSGGTHATWEVPVERGDG
ncbi:MAG: PAS domain S-box protein [Actinobacteria bacterium]|nr:PAS domain S-box protein [Actinomycetota bacterium]